MITHMQNHMQMTVPLYSSRWKSGEKEHQGKVHERFGKNSRDSMRIY